MSDEVDLVVVNDVYKILAFKSEELVLKYARQNELPINTEVTHYNMYNIQQWLNNPSSTLDSKEFLDFWNLCTDIAASINKPFLGDLKGKVRDDVYDKLFDGGGPWFMASGTEPKLNDTEVRTLSNVLKQGHSLLLNNVLILE